MAPAKYKVIFGPGTLEITTLANAGMVLAKRERAKPLAKALNSHGTPIEGKSVGSRVFISVITDFTPWLDARMACNRSIGSLMLLAKLILAIDT